jgi:hypothetical protein
MKKKVVKFPIKINHLQRINTIAERLKLQPGELVALWISQQIRKYESVLDKKNTTKEKNP